MDAAVRNQFLQGYFGASKGANAPVSHTLHLFAGDPEEGGTELTTGYTAPALTNDGTQWPAADFDAGFLTGALVTFSFTADLSDAATHWRLKDPSGNWGPSGALASEWFGGAGTSRSVQPVVYVASEVV